MSRSGRKTTAASRYGHIDPRYRRWLEVADDLDALHQWLYAPHGPLRSIRHKPLEPTCAYAAEAIRNYCLARYKLFYWMSWRWRESMAHDSLVRINRSILGAISIYEAVGTARPMLERTAAILNRVAVICGRPAPVTKVARPTAGRWSVIDTPKP